MSFAKQLAASFLGGLFAFATVAGLSLLLVRGYVDSKFEVVDSTLARVEGVLEVADMKIDALVTVATNGIEKVDGAITDTKVYNRFFGPKTEEAK